MAKTGSISFSYSQDTANNKSTVTVSGIIKTTGESYRGDSRTGTYTVKKGSTTLANNRSFTHGAPANSTTTLFSETFIIPHDDEGKCETITASYNYDSGWCSASGSLSLPTIARKSTLSVANGTLGTAQTLTISEKASAFNHKLSYKCGSVSGYILGSASATSSTLSTSWTPPLDLAKQNTTGTSVSITFTLETYSGSTLIGSNTYSNKTFAIPASVKPTCSIAVSDYTGYESKYGGYVKNKSRLSVSITAGLAYDSAIKSYSTSVNGTTYPNSYFTTEVLKTAGSMTVTSTVTDKRDRSGSASTTINVLDYSAPTVSTVKVLRCNSNGAENDQGGYVKVTFSASVTSLSNKNSAEYTLQYKKSTDAVYTSVELSDYKNNYNVSNASLAPIPMDTESSYDIVLTAKDDFGTTNKSTVVSTAYTLLDFHDSGKSLSVGKVAEVEEGFELGANTYVHDGYEMNVHFGKANQYDMIAKVDELDTDVDALNTGVSTLNTSVTTLNTSVATLNTSVTTLSNGLDGAVLKTLSFSGTTDSNGNLKVIYDDDAIDIKAILFAWNGQHVFTPFYYNHTWYLHVASSNLNSTGCASTSISCSIYYIKG